MENSTISLFWNSSISSSFISFFSCVCLVAIPNTGDDTWDQWQQQRQWVGSSNTFSRPSMDAWWQRGRRVGLKLCACSCSAGGGLTALPLWVESETWFIINGSLLYLVDLSICMSATGCVELIYVS
jgi:hypothetical protein